MVGCEWRARTTGPLWLAGRGPLPRASHRALSAAVVGGPAQGRTGCVISLRASITPCPGSFPAACGETASGGGLISLQWTGSFASGQVRLAPCPPSKFCCHGCYGFVVWNFYRFDKLESSCGKEHLSYGLLK